MMWSVQCFIKVLFSRSVASRLFKFMKEKTKLVIVSGLRK